MRMTRSAALAAALGAAGLVITAVAIWAGPGTGPASEVGPVPDLSPSVAASPAAPAPSPAARPDGVRRVDASLSATAGSEVSPVRIGLPAVGIDARVRPVGVAPDGQMALPPDPRVMGWYRFGPTPGESAGSAVVAGHLDARRFGLGPLVRLREVEVGHRVAVELSDGSTQAFVVRRVDRFDRQGLPAEVFSRTGPGVLRIITCGGAYLPDEGGYQQNLVVTAEPA